MVVATEQLDDPAASRRLSVDASRLDPVADVRATCLLLRGPLVTSAII
jgi:hypothetical protein